MMIEWQTEAPARLAEFRAILKEARTYYLLNPGSETETRIWVRSDGRLGGRRMLCPFEMVSADGFTWPVCDIDRNSCRGWMGFSLDSAFANAIRMRADYFTHRAQKYVEVA
jgi:hypothetical protein